MITVTYVMDAGALSIHVPGLFLDPLTTCKVASSTIEHNFGDGEKNINIELWAFLRKKFGASLFPARMLKTGEAP